MQKQCEFVNPDTKERCKGFALESGLCFSHDPASKEAKMDAVLKGGLAFKKIRLDLPAVPIKTVEDVVIVLEETINAVRTGELPVSNPANTIGFLCSHILKAIEISSVGPKLEVIDRMILERKMTERHKR